MLIFNKQYQTEKKIIDELAKKIKKSETISRQIKINEVYKIPGMYICFDLNDYKLSVDAEKAIHGDRKAIFALNCKFDNHDEMQYARHNWFGYLLECARKRWDNEIAKQAKQKSEKMKNAQKKVAAKRINNDFYQAMLENALKDIREI